jgi:hypothetical protein
MFDCFCRRCRSLLPADLWVCVVFCALLWLSSLPKFARCSMELVRRLTVEACCLSSPRSKGARSPIHRRYKSRRCQAGRVLMPCDCCVVCEQLNSKVARFGDFSCRCYLSDSRAFVCKTQHMKRLRSIAQVSSTVSPELIVLF